LTEDEAGAALDLPRAATSLEDLADCTVVIEAVFEDLGLKQSIFSQLEDIVSDDAILASNTSSLLIASIAKSCRHRERIAGMHFFNPVPLMKLVEVIRGPETSPDVVAVLNDLGRRMGREPVTVKDAPGFLVNHGGRAYTTEAMRVLHERVASAPQIDAVMRECCGFRMGPFELADLTGIDVNYPVSQIVYNGYNQDPRLKTSFPHLSLYEAGRFGRKTGQGTYTYDENNQTGAVEGADFISGANPAGKIHIDRTDDAAEAFFGPLDGQIIPDDDGESPIVAALLGEDCTAYAWRTGVDHRRLVAIDLQCDPSKRVTLMTAPGADPAHRSAVAALIAGSGRAVTMIHDSPGFISQRIRAMVANLGCEMAQIGIAEPENIDLAMRLGLNYPLGPLELAEQLGLSDTMTVLEHLQAITGEDRYRPSLWLKRRAALDLPIHTTD
ncbi:MAG: 3-hydroxyacyl-CoA dehydrogenase NAD-binding domain-containing protein, partial [Hyphomicrobiales bacterium]|nr:3-hydroxyacyl-CoA dehydrogenase NAD-binding domain-containing protein [Hyphomicrobiales bacterium]